MACQKSLSLSLSLKKVTPHEATTPNPVTLEADYQDLGTFVGWTQTQLVIHVGRVLVSPVSAAAVPWYMTNADRNPPPKQTVLISNI